MPGRAASRQQPLPLSHGRAARSPHARPDATAGVRSAPPLNRNPAYRTAARAPPLPPPAAFPKPEAAAAAHARGHGGLRTLGASALGPPAGRTGRGGAEGAPSGGSGGRLSGGRSPGTSGRAPAPKPAAPRPTPAKPAKPAEPRPKDPSGGVPRPRGGAGAAPSSRPAPPPLWGKRGGDEGPPIPFWLRPADETSGERERGE
ncbi:hypothetical protein GCM10009678_51120 [Actinomadura kijaniata]